MWLRRSIVLLVAQKPNGHTTSERARDGQFPAQLVAPASASSHTGTRSSSSGILWV